MSLIVLCHTQKFYVNTDAKIQIFIEIRNKNAKKIFIFAQIHFVVQAKVHYFLFYLSIMNDVRLDRKSFIILRKLANHKPAIFLLALNLNTYGKLLQLILFMVMMNYCFVKPHRISYDQNFYEGYDNSYSSLGDDISFLFLSTLY